MNGSYYFFLERPVSSEYTGQVLALRIFRSLTSLKKAVILGCSVRIKRDVMKGRTYRAQWVKLRGDVQSH